MNQTNKTNKQKRKGRGKKEKEVLGLCFLPPQIDCHSNCKTNIVIFSTVIRLDQEICDCQIKVLRKRIIYQSPQSCSWIQVSSNIFEQPGEVSQKVLY